MVIFRGGGLDSKTYYSVREHNIIGSLINIEQKSMVSRMVLILNKYMDSKHIYFLCILYCLLGPPNGRRTSRSADWDNN